MSCSVSKRTARRPSAMMSMIVPCPRLGCTITAPFKRLWLYEGFLSISYPTMSGTKRIITMNGHKALKMRRVGKPPMQVHDGKMKAATSKLKLTSRAASQAPSSGGNAKP